MVRRQPFVIRSEYCRRPVSFIVLYHKNGGRKCCLLLLLVQKKIRQTSWHGSYPNASWVSSWCAFHSFFNAALGPFSHTHAPQASHLGPCFNRCLNCIFAAKYIMHVIVCSPQKSKDWWWTGRGHTIYITWIWKQPIKGSSLAVTLDCWCCLIITGFAEFLWGFSTNGQLLVYLGVFIIVTTSTTNQT